MTHQDALTGAWLCLTGWESQNEIWVRADNVRVVLEGVPEKAETTPAPTFTFPGQPNPGPSFRMAGRPYTLIGTANGTYKVRETVDFVLERLAEVLRGAD